MNLLLSSFNDLILADWKDWVDCMLWRVKEDRGFKQDKL